MDLNLNFNISEFEGEHKALPLDPDTLYDILIIGGGPAAMTAAVYCMRKGVKTGLITKSVGGQVAETASVENYLGFKYIEGLNLVEKFRDHFQQFEIGYKEGFKAIEVIDGKHKTIKLEDGSRYRCKALIITTGKTPRRLNIPGEAELSGRGVAYCAICDAPLFADKKVAVVGGGNSGVEAALDLAKTARQVTLIQDLDRLTADRILIERLKKFDNFDILLNHKVQRINGREQVESITVRDLAQESSRDIKLEGVFVEIGLIPNTDFLSDILELNQWGEIVIDCACHTSASGIFAAGDATTVPYKQIIIAAGDGAMAALSACNYILKQS